MRQERRASIPAAVRGSGTTTRARAGFAMSLKRNNKFKRQISGRRTDFRSFSARPGVDDHDDVHRDRHVDGGLRGVAGLIVNRRGIND